MRSIEGATIEDLNLSDSILKKLQGFSATEIIEAARENTLESFPGIGAIKAARIHAAVDEAGFLFHEDEESAAIRRLICKLTGFEYDYESQEAFTDEQCQKMYSTLENALLPREGRIIKMRFGINPYRPATLEECGIEFNINTERVRQIEAKALRRLKRPFILKPLAYALGAMNAADAVEVEKQQTAIAVRQANADTILEKIGDTPIEKLDLSVRAYNCLKYKHSTLADICAMTRGDLLRVRNLGASTCAEIEEVLSKYGVSLREDSPS